VGLEFEPDYKAFIASNPTLFPQSPSTLPNNSTLTQVGKKFKFPQIWRSNIAVDVELPWSMIFTAEAMYSKDINAVQQININLSDPTGTLFGPDNVCSGQTALLPSCQHCQCSYGAEKYQEGYQYSLTAMLTKNFSKGLSGMFAYTYTESKDISANPGSSAYSAYSSNTSIGSLNDPEMSYSLFSTPHKLIGSVSYKIEYAKHFATTLSLVYQGYQTGRWTYTIPMT